MSVIQTDRKDQLNVSRIRKDFPILERKVHGRRLVYLDNAATSQKPACVLAALDRYYRTMNANIHRGIHTLAEEATAAYEGTRKRVAAFLGNVDVHGVVFTRGTTEAINLLAQAVVRPRLKPGDEILLTEMEHHSNLVPWILVAQATGAKLRHIPVRDDGMLDLAKLPGLLSPRTKAVSVMHVSNVLGTVNPVAEIAAAARRAAPGVVVIVDAAQSAPHRRVVPAELGCDFLAFSAHKMFGPTGVGVLWGRPELLEAAEPYQGGGEMIREVHLDRATWNKAPWKFEAGTQNIADVCAFAAALDYLEGLGLDAVREHGEALADYAMERLAALEHMTIYGPPRGVERAGVVSFNEMRIHPHDLSTMLDQEGVAIRAGHHCAQPLMRRLGVVATSRATFYLYNDRDDVDMLIEAILKARKYFKV